MKKYSKFTSAAFASAMALAAMGTPVFATNTDNSQQTGDTTSQPVIGGVQESLKITKNIAVRNNVPVPSTTFNFKIEQGTAVAATPTSQPILAGPENGLQYTVGEGTTSTSTTTPAIPFSPTTDSTLEVVDGKYTKEITLSINTAAFTGDYAKPGIYRYVVTETTGEYDGMEYDGTNYYVDIYKDNDGSYNAVAYKVTGDTTAEAKEDGLVFNNDFSKIDQDKPDSGTREITLAKTVTGNQGDKNKEFAFTFKVTASTDTAESQESGEMYTYQKGKIVDGEFVPATGASLEKFASGVEQNISLKDGEVVQIYGISPNDTVETEETVKNQDGYTTKVNGVATTENANDGDLTGVINEDKTITWNNDRSVTTPTGILLTAAPYAAVIGLGGVFAGLFFRRKRED